MSSMECVLEVYYKSCYMLGKFLMVVIVSVSQLVNSLLVVHIGSRVSDERVGVYSEVGRGGLLWYWCMK